MADRYSHPDGGAPIDTAGRPVSADPIPGGVAVVNASLPTDHEAHVVYREHTTAEKRLQTKTQKETVGFRRADTLLFARMTRDAMLRATDHFEMLPEAQAKKAAGGPAKHEAWKKWRQQLRDLPSKLKKAAAEPEDIEWPQPPAAISSLVEHRRLFPDIDWDRLTKSGGETR